MDLQKQLRIILANGVGTPIIIIVMLAMMILPLPSYLLDLSFTFNIVFSMVVLLACVYCQRPLEFAVFPTVLLIATLLRLALNIASTRIILLHGHTGSHAAGHVIESFGNVVIGGNYIVGIIVFTILIIINFVVVTKGAGRISEVSARFTLDAMPGKQMAIDADLNAGLITQQEAKERRKEIAMEADFYGSMDGAGKFVRGDAVAGILVLLINIIGGLIIGIVQYNMPFTDAMQNYSLLTIGDGLVAQIPSLLLSTVSAIMVTRLSSSHDMGQQVTTQLFAEPKNMLITAAVLLVLGLIPGMPHLVFLLFALATGAAGYWLILKRRKALEEPEEANTSESEEKVEEQKELSWDDVQQLDRIGLEVGYRLIPLVDKAQGGPLMGRIKGVRKKLSQELGFLIPSIHIRDNLDLLPNTYRITMSGVVLGQGEIFPDKFLAINPGQVYGNIEGIVTKDPAFGLEAIWIDANKREQAHTLGYTVVDASTVVATHLSQLMQHNASSLLGYEEVQQLLERLAKKAPKLVEELIPATLSMAAVVKVLQQLLEEKIPIADCRTIVETLIEAAHKSKETEYLTAQIRCVLNRLIVQTIHGDSVELPIATLNHELEQLLQNSIQMSSQAHIGIEPGLAERIQRSIMEFVQQQEILGQPAVLVVAPAIRRLLAKFMKQITPALNVLSFQEIPDHKQIKIIGTVG